MPTSLIALAKLYRKHQRHLQRQAQSKNPATDSRRASQHTLAYLSARILRHASVSSIRKRSEIKHRLLIERLEMRDSALSLVVPSTAVIQGIKMWPVSL